MKSNIITIFPAIVLEQNKVTQPEKINPEACVDFLFNKTRIVSYKKLKEDLKAEIKLIELIDRIQLEIIDANGELLDDFTIVIDKNVETNSLEPPNLDSQHVLTYFAYVQHLDHWVNIDFIKIIYRSVGQFIYVNNSNDHIFRKYLYFLPIAQKYKRKVLIQQNSQMIVIKILARLTKHDTQKYRRLITAISLFNESCRISRVSPNSSVVLMVSALEAMLHLPRMSKKDNFTYALKLLWGFDERIEEWASELYEIRSQIVHGDVVSGEQLLASKDKHYPHFEIARGLFHDCLLFILEGHGDIQIDPTYKHDTIKDLRNKVISNKEKVQSILKSKSKFSYKAFLKNKDLYEEFLLRLEELTFLDHSADHFIEKILILIMSISEPWLIEQTKKPVTKGDLDLKEHLKFQKTRYHNMLSIIAKIKSIKWTERNKFEINHKIRELEDEVRKAEPVVHHKENFYFTITEFLDRSLRSISSLI